MSRNWRWFAGLFLLGLVAVAGCSNTAHEDERMREAYSMPASAAAAPADRKIVLASADTSVFEGKNPPPNAGADRKIIYSAAVELVVEDFSGMGERVSTLVKKFGGYVADSNLSGASGQNRRATWRIRVPVAEFDSFLLAAKDLGELVTASTTSHDVSEEYYDVEARIRNKTREEERLLKLLEDRPGKLEDVIAIERELSRVREELERMQGRMRVLADQTALTTVQLTVTEIRGYEPPQAPTLATRVRRTFESSLGGVVSFGEDCLILAVALVPWIPVLGGICLAAYLLYRAVRRRLGRLATGM